MMSGIKESSWATPWRFAAVPLFKGDSNSPPDIGGEPRSGRGSLTRHVEIGLGAKPTGQLQTYAGGENDLPFGKSISADGVNNLPSIHEKMRKSCGE
jgi:hypothetical protein